MLEKILIVYYSLTGNTKYIAEAIQEVTKADILAIKPIKELNPKGAMKYMWGAAQATMKKKPKLEHIEINPNDYDLIFLGTPVWAWTFSPPIRSFLSEYDLSEKIIAIWCCHGGGPGQTLKKLKEYTKATKVLGEIDFFDPLKNKPDEAKEKVIIWANDIIKEGKL